MAEQNGFPLVPLGEVLEFVSRPEKVEPQKIYSILGAHWYARGLYIKETKPGSQIRSQTVYRVTEGDFVYNRLFGWKGSFAVATKQTHNCYVSNEFQSFSIASDKLDDHYLWYYFSRATVWDEALGLSTGSTATSRNRLKVDKLLNMEIPLPPLHEQRRIVARIEELAARIAEARGLRAQAAEEAEALVVSTARNIIAELDQEIKPVRCWLDPEREGIQTGPFGAQLSSKEFVDSGVPVLTIGNVQYSGLELDHIQHVSIEKAEHLARYKIQEGDILFARMGTVGRCCVVPSSAEGWLINYHIIRVALDRTQIDPRYVHWTIHTSKDVEEYLTVKIRGATRQGVNSTIVGGIPCRVPPLPEQRRIVAYLDDLQTRVDAVKRLQADTAAELDALLPAVLDRAFRGAL
jgi:type I restriction enzyme S subunit